MGNWSTCSLLSGFVGGRSARSRLAPIGTFRRPRWHWWLHTRSFSLVSKSKHGQDANRIRA
jgi:hypothetical protein